MYLVLIEKNNKHIQTNFWYTNLWCDSDFPPIWFKNKKYQLRLCVMKLLPFDNVKLKTILKRSEIAYYALIDDSCFASPIRYSQDLTNFFGIDIS